jgi:hypothetical protein
VCARLAIADELVLKGEPDFARDDSMLFGDVLKLAVDCAENAGEEDALHVLPRRVIDGRGIKENVVSEVIALQGEKNLIMPAGIACTRMVQNSQNKGANIMYPAGLRMKHGDDDGITRRGWGLRRTGGGSC